MPAVAIAIEADIVTPNILLLMVAAFCAPSKTIVLNAPSVVAMFANS